MATDHDLSNLSVEDLRCLHQSAMATVNDLNRSISRLMILRNWQGDWGRAAWEELQLRESADGD